MPIKYPLKFPVRSLYKRTIMRIPGVHIQIWDLCHCSTHAFLALSIDIMVDCYMFHHYESTMLPDGTTTLRCDGNIKRAEIMLKLRPANWIILHMFTDVFNISLSAKYSVKISELFRNQIYFETDDLDLFKSCNSHI